MGTGTITRAGPGGELDTLMAILPTGVVLSSADGVIVHANDAFSTVLCRRPRQLAGLPLAEALGEFDPDAPARWAAIEESVREEGECRGVEFQVQTDQGLRFIAIDASMVDREEGSILSVWRDTTPLRMRQQELIKNREFITLFENTPVMMLLVDKDRRVRQANRAARDFAGWYGGAVVGEPVGRLIGCLNRLDDSRGCGFGEECRRCGMRTTVLDTMETGRAHFDVESNFPAVVRGFREDLTVAISTIPLKVGSEKLTLVSLKDMTSHKRLEDQLRESNRHLRKEATSDSLTKVANRRRFDDYVDREWRRMSRDGRHLSLIMCDVDHFKLYNDRYGHQPGDECLRQVAETIRSSLSRPGDFVARYGGEEFGVILPDTDQHGARHTAERIRRRMEELAIPHENSPVEPHVTLSLGVSTAIPQAGDSPAGLIRAADEALYEAKESGRNRVVFR